jgi:uncharacterized protein YlxW (UPF0749 family)
MTQQDNTPQTQDALLQAELTTLRDDLTHLQARVEALEQPAAQTPPPVLSAEG